MVILLCIVAFAGFIAGYMMRSPQAPASINDHQILLSAIDSMKSDSYAFPKSNLEWVSANIGLTPKEFMKQSLIATTVVGKVAEAKKESGSMPIASKYYFVGNPGLYAYESTIGLTDVNGEAKTFYFSPKRTQMMKVVRVVKGREIPATFADIKTGSRVEVTETVDLAQSNINDANLVSLIVRMY